MIDYQKYINALRKCAKEHESDITFTAHIIVSDLCRDTANLLESLEQQPCEDTISRQAAIDDIKECAEAAHDNHEWDMEQSYLNAIACIEELPSAQPEPIKINIEDFNKEDWERLKKEWGNTPITVLPSAQETRQSRH